MQDDATPRGLPERTAKHYCVQCLAQIPVEEYFRNDFLCDRCGAKDDYPLASTPDAPQHGKGDAPRPGKKR